jgi:hypothetical protein
VILGSGRPINGVIYEGADAPNPVTLNIEVRSGADVIGSQQVSQLVQSDPTVFAYSIPVPDAFIGQPLNDLQLVVHIQQSVGTSWTDSRKAQSYVDLPVSPSLVPPGSSVQVTVDDATFANPAVAALAADGTWSSPLSLAGLASDPVTHTVYARALSGTSAGAPASAGFTIGTPPPSPGRVQVQVVAFGAAPSATAWINAADGAADGTYSTWSAMVDTTSLKHGRYSLYYRVLRADGTALQPGPTTIYKY